MNDGIGEFATAEEQSAFFEEIAALANGERKAAIQQKKLELRARYAAPREQLIASNPRYAGTPLVVIEDHRELYRQVLTRFSSLLPTESRFVTEFNRYVERL